MAETPTPQDAPQATERSADPRERARALLSSGQPRETIRRELAALRESELLRLMHEAAVMDASPFWREIALRRFIRQKSAG